MGMRVYSEGGEVRKEEGETDGQSEVGGRGKEGRRRDGRTE